MFYIYADGNSICEPWDESLTIHSPKLTLEMGKAGSLTFQIPPTNKFYNQIQQLRTIITVELDEVEIFRGRVLTNNRSFNNMRTIYCEGNLAYLVDSVQKGEKFEGTTHDLFRKIINAHNARVEAGKQFAIGNIGIENRSIVIAGTSDDIVDLETDKFNYEQIAINSMVDEWQTSLDYIESTLISYCGGYLRTRRVGGTTYIDFLENYGNTTVQEIEFGVNMLDLTEEVSSDEVFTVLIPLGEDNLTIASVNRGSDELVDEEAVRRYGRIVKTYVFDSVNKASTLLENGKRYLANHTNIPITITVTAVDMHLLDKSVAGIYIGDRVHVHSLPHDIADYLTCTKIEYDLENPANNVYTFGTPRQALTERYRKDRAKSEQTAKRNGGRGGGGAGGAASGAAEDDTQKQLDKFFDAWINVDKEAAHIDLGTMYKEFKNAKEVLESYCGITLDAPSGNINIQTLRKEFDDMGQEIKNQHAYIDLLNNETMAQIAIITANHKTLEDRELEHYADITTRIDDESSRITLNAQAIETQKQESKDIKASIDMLADEQKAQIALEATHHQAVQGQISDATARITALAKENEASVKVEAQLRNSIASIETRVTKEANGLQSQINLKADKTTINGQITEINTDITRIKSSITEVKKLIADEIDSVKGDISWLTGKSITLQVGLYAPYVRASKELTVGLKAVATQEWVNGKKFLTSVPSDLYLSKLQATNIVASSTLKIGLQPVATQYWCTTTQGFATKAWVNEQLKSYSKSSHSHSWRNITDKPSKFSPAAHKHAISFYSQGATKGTGHQHQIKGNTDNN